MSKTGLTVYRHETLPPLVHALGDTLAARRPENPLTGFSVAVPSFAVVRWLTEQLATRNDGPYAHVANLYTCFPGALIDNVLAAVLQDDATGRYRTDALTWTILHLLRASADAPVYDAIRPAAPHAGAHPFGVSFARHTADLFDRYIRHRPELLDSWALGDDVDSENRPLATHLLWQPTLWRSILATTTEKPPHQRVAEATQRLNDTNDCEALAAQYLLFGVHGVATNEMTLIDALARHRPVTLFLLTASRTFAFDAPANPANPWLGLFTIDAQAQHRHVADAKLHATLIDLDDPKGAQPVTALTRIKAQLTRDLPPVNPEQRGRVALGDNSITVHACHGIVREIDAVKDQLLALLDADDTLQPNDIAILTPDLATFAPVIAGVLSDGDERGDATRNQPRLPFAIRDRSVAKTNPVADVITQLFTLAESRVTLNAVADLLTTELIVEQLGLSVDDITDVIGLFDTVGIRFGIDAEHRATHGAAKQPVGSFQYGFDRLLLGVALDNPGDTLLYDVAPHTLTDTGVTQHFLTVHSFLTDVFAAIKTWQAPRTLADWVHTTQTLIDTLLATPLTNYDRQADTDTVQRITDELLTHAHDHTTVELTLNEYADVFERALTRHGVAGVNDTGITVSSLLGVRSIPFRVVCLVGMNDHVLAKPAQDVIHDLVSTSPRATDTTSRDETRQLVYDAIINTTDNLIVTHTAFDPARGDTQPRARILDDLTELIDATLTGEAGPASTQLTRTHPRQLTHPVYYTQSSPLLRTDRLGLEQAVATLTDQPTHTSRFDSLPAPTGEPVTVGRFITALTDPSKAFLARHGIRIVHDEEDVNERDMFTLRGLDAYHVFDEMLHWPDLATLPQFIDALPYRGKLPHGSFGLLAQDDVHTFARDVYDLQHRLHADRHTTDVHVTVDNTTFTGHITTHGSDVVTRTASQTAAKALVGVWVNMLVLTVNNGAPAGGSVWYRTGTTLTELRLDPVSVDDAYQVLSELSALRQQVLTTPTPLFARTSYAYATRIHKGDSEEQALRDAQAAWDPHQVPGDSDNQAVRYLYGYDVPFHQIAASGVFQTAANRLFSPLLAAMNGGAS